MAMDDSRYVSSVLIQSWSDVMDDKADPFVHDCQEQEILTVEQLPEWTRLT